MADHVPTKSGDVLVLHTKTSFETHAIQVINQDGQQDFLGVTDVEYVGERAQALARARALVTPHGRIFVWDIDVDAWAEIPRCAGH